MTLLEAIATEKKFRCLIDWFDDEDVRYSEWMIFNGTSFVDEDDNVLALPQEMLLSSNYEVAIEGIIVIRRELEEAVTRAFGYCENPENQVVDKLDHMKHMICEALGFTEPVTNYEDV